MRYACRNCHATAGGTKARIPAGWLRADVCRDCGAAQGNGSAPDLARESQRLKESRYAKVERVEPFRQNGKLRIRMHLACGHTAVRRPQKFEGKVLDQPVVCGTCHGD